MTVSFPLTAIHVSHILIQHLWSNITANIYWAFSECQALSWALEKSTQSILKIIQGNKEWLHFWCLMTISFQATAFLPTSAPYLGKLWYERSGLKKKRRKKDRPDTPFELTYVQGSTSQRGQNLHLNSNNLVSEPRL